MTTSRLALGSVQFGLNYGIANSSGQVNHKEVGRIFASANSIGINTVDTAIAYGDSEQIIGTMNLESWNIISKLPALPDKCPSVSSWVMDQVSQSLTKLNSNRLHGLLLHRPDQLLESNGDELYRALLELKESGLVEKIGISIYSPDQLSQLLHNFPCDIVQGPFNVLDRRIATSGWLDKLHKNNCEFHARSIFLQGLLLMSSHTRPRWFQQWEQVWQVWAQWLQNTGQTPIQACLLHVLADNRINKLVVGVDSVTHLEEIHSATTGKPLEAPSLLDTDEQDLLNPANWQKNH